MSLYSEHEICGDCIYATMFDCGQCLKECVIEATDNRNFMHGTCSKKVTETEEIKDG